VLREDPMQRQVAHSLTQQGDCRLRRIAAIPEWNTDPITEFGPSMGSMDVQTDGVDMWCTARPAV
jgi:hypothetical protein